MSKSTNPFLKGALDPSQSQRAGDEGLLEISQRLDQCHLEGSVARDNETPIFAWAADHPKRSEATVHGSSRVEPNLLNNQITTGRDTNLHLNAPAYHVTGNLIQVRTAKESDNEHSESRRNNVDDEDNVAAGMLIPAAPPCILERDSQQSQIVAKLLAIPNAKVAILGMGGIGKTTLACSVANDSEVVDAYPRRLFLSFEGCSSPDLAFANLAIAFCVSADRRSSHKQILSQVLNYLRQGKILLIIDNFETFWEVPPNRRAAEDLLGQLAALPNLTLIVTLRGIQRPGNIRWVKIEPLQTLTHEAAKELLSVITDEEYTKGDSEYIRKLLDGVAGIPLAVTLIGSLLRDNCETPQSLWNRWTRESTEAIGIANDTEPDDRLYKLDVSLRLSIFGPRMSNNTKEVLAAIATLPTGLNIDETWLERFQDTLPSTISIRSCISALQNVALCILESNTSPQRLKLLPPVRDFCLRNMPLDSALGHRLTDMYITDLLAKNVWGSSENYDWVTMELSNISAMLNLAITYLYLPDNFGFAIHEYTEWRRLLCIPDTDTVGRAIEVLSEHLGAKAECLQALGSTLAETNREREAIRSLEHALSIHNQLKDKLEAGRDLYFLGDTYYRLDDYANSERCLNEARDLTTEFDDRWIEGGVLEALANVYFKQGKLPQAESTAKEALELERGSSDRKGEINALWTLGRVYRAQGEYDLAVEALTAARDASQAIHDIYAEACANESLGYAYRDNSKPREAAPHFILAISLFERAQRPTAAEKIRAALMELEASLVTPDP